MTFESWEKEREKEGETAFFVCSLATQQFRVFITMLWQYKSIFCHASKTLWLELNWERTGGLMEVEGGGGACSLPFLWVLGQREEPSFARLNGELCGSHTGNYTFTKTWTLCPQCTVTGVKYISILQYTVQSVFGMWHNFCCFASVMKHVLELHPFAAHRNILEK